MRIASSEQSAGAIFSCGVAGVDAPSVSMTASTALRRASEVRRATALLLMLRAFLFGCYVETALIEA